MPICTLIAFLILTLSTTGAHAEAIESQPFYTGDCPTDFFKGAALHCEKYIRLKNGKVAFVDMFESDRASKRNKILKYCLNKGMLYYKGENIASDVVNFKIKSSRYEGNGFKYVLNDQTFFICNDYEDKAELFPFIYQDCFVTKETMNLGKVVGGYKDDDFTSLLKCRLDN